MITYGSHGALLYKNGYQVIPLSPGSKIPVTEGWVSASSPPAFSDYSNCSIAIRCGVSQSVYAIDIDVKDINFINSLVRTTGINSPYRIGNPPKRLYLFRGESDKIRKKSSAKYIEGHIEILGFGQYFAAFGIHPVTKRPYQWPNGGSPLSIPVAELPVLTENGMRKVLRIFEDLADTFGFTVKERKKENSDREYDSDNPLFEKEPLNIPEKELITMVNCIDPDCGRDQWRDIGFALHHETSGSEIGYRIWDEWSAKGTKYKEGETEYQWDSFGRTDREPITAAYLKKLYKDNQLEKTEKVISKEVGINPDDPFAAMNWSVDRFSSELPPLDMVINNLMPKGITALFYSAGGAGKSTLMLYLALRVSYASIFPLDFAGYDINGGSVVILTAEDPEVILNRRFIAVITELSRELDIDREVIEKVLLEKLHIASTFGKSLRLFGITNDSVKPTKAFVSFLKRLKNIPDLQLVIIDTKTRYSPGEGLGNVSASDEVGYYEMIALATGASVILLHHTNKKSRDGSQDGAQAYRDATAWFDNTRFSWFFRPATEKELALESIKAIDASDYYILENAKNNYVKRHKNKLVHREGYNFIFTDAISKEEKGDIVDRKNQDLIDSIVFWMQSLKENDLRQAEIIQWAKTELNAGRSRVKNALSSACEDGILQLNTNSGQSNRYSLTEYGVLYNLKLE